VTSPYSELNFLSGGRPAMTKADVAYRQIRREIVEGILPPGETLDQEALALRLGLSTTPVREALSRLESEELIINRPHRKTVVAPLSFTMLEETYAVRLALDPLAAAFAASQANDEERARIKELSEHEPEGEDPIAHLHHNRLLHRAIYAACGNTVLIQILDVLWDRSDRYRLATLKDNSTIDVAKDEHAAIVAAVLEGDGRRAADLMSEHVADSLQRIRETNLEP
jgi:DNA-binding GntR family transcriptional regulator